MRHLHISLAVSPGKLETSLANGGGLPRGEWTGLLIAATVGIVSLAPSTLMIGVADRMPDAVLSWENGGSEGGDEPRESPRGMGSLGRWPRWSGGETSEIDIAMKEARGSIGCQDPLNPVSF